MNHDVPRSRSAQELGRRAFLKASAVVGLVGLGAGRATAATKKTTKKVTTTTKKAATTTTKAAAAATTTKAAAKATGAPFAETMELAVTFTFASSDARGRNPYVAVWLEDMAGNSVRTIDLSVQLGRGLRYVDRLTRWYTADMARISKGGQDLIETISSATRVSGTYEAVWDGRSDTGELLPQGTYVLSVEAAREHGPYEILRAELAIGTTPLEKSLGSNGELQNVVAKLRAKA